MKEGKMHIILGIGLIILGGIFGLSLTGLPSFVKKEKPPKVVHNKCTGKWAVEIFPYYYLSGRMAEESVFTDSRYTHNMKIYLMYWPSPAGEETMFGDSITAAKTMDAYIAGERESNEQHKRETKIRDSIFKCQHTYQ